MTLHIAECPLGIFAYGEKRKIIDSKIFQKNPKKVSEKLITIIEGNPLEEHEELIKELIEDGYNEFIFESEKITKKLRKKFEKATFKTQTPNRAGKELRNSIREIANSSEREDISKYLSEVNLEMTRKKIKEEVSEKDKIVIESINTIDELDRTINSLYEKIRDWYSIHFPELERHISDYSDYMDIVMELGKRENFTKEKLTDLGLSENDAEKIQKDAQNSIGAKLEENDIDIIKKNIEKVKGLQKVREKNSEYIENLMDKVAPNLKSLVGSLIGARLISLAGGLEDLAKMPSSTVQVLGAEKALFRSLQKGGKPPKHGVIFQHPEIRGSPEHLRGKIARALAGKLTIAARVDSVSGRYIGDSLNEELNERIETIKQSG